MGQRWTTEAGWQIELLDNGRQMYRVTGWGGVYVAVCYTLDELQEFLAVQGVDLADLTELLIEARVIPTLSASCS